MRARQRQTLEAQGETVGWGGSLSRLRWSLLPSARTTLCGRKHTSRWGGWGHTSPPPTQDSCSAQDPGRVVTESTVLARSHISTDMAWGFVFLVT